MGRGYYWRGSKRKNECFRAKDLRKCYICHGYFYYRKKQCTNFFCPQYSHTAATLFWGPNATDIPAVPPPEWAQKQIDYVMGDGYYAQAEWQQPANDKDDNNDKEWSAAIDGDKNGDGSHAWSDAYTNSDEVVNDQDRDREPDIDAHRDETNNVSVETEPEQDIKTEQGTDGPNVTIKTKHTNDHSDYSDGSSDEGELERKRCKRTDVNADKAHSMPRPSPNEDCRSQFEARFGSCLSWEDI